MPKKHKINRKREEEKKKEKIKIREKILKETESLSKRIKEKELDAQAREFYDIIRKFYAKLFRIKYQFTYEELQKEIEKKKIDPRYKTRIEKFIKKLTYMEYSNITLTNERLKELISEFNLLVKKLTDVEKEEKKDVSRRLDKLRKKIVKKANIFKKLKIKKVSKPNQIINEINLLLKEGNEFKKSGHISKAQHIYVKIDSLYRQLSLKDKDKIHEKISKVYKKKEPIYDLLNQAYSALVEHKTHEARQLYVKITELYTSLPASEKEKMHDEILKVFRPKHREDMDSLLRKAYFLLAKKEINKLKEVYETIEITYRDIPEKEKTTYYPQLIRLYDDIRVIFA